MTPPQSATPRGVSPGPKGGRRPESEQETEAEGPGAVRPARLSRQGTGYSAAASAHPQPHSTPEPLDAEFRASSWVGFSPSITGYAPLRTAQSQFGRWREDRRREVRRVLTGKSHGRQCPDLPRLQP